MEPRPLLPNEVVQLNPTTVKNLAFAGCFMIVIEPKLWGAWGFVQVLSEDRSTPGCERYYHAGYDEMEPIGMAVWAPIGGSEGLQNTTESANPGSFPPLDRETRTAVDTDCAAFHLNRKPQTLRGWACHENGPLRPIRVHGRLAWSVADLRRVLEGTSTQRRYGHPFRKFNGAV